MKRIGLMGCGDVATFGHIPAILQTEGLELAGIFDPDPEKLQAAVQRFGHFPIFLDPHELLNQDLDAVVITSPAHVHKQNVEMAAQHGVHVLCEKPIAMNDKEGQAMIRAMKKADRMFFVGFVYRFSPVAQQIKRWVEEKTVGEIRSLRLIYIWDLHGEWEQNETGEWVKSERYRGRMLEGGPMVDCGVHQIDLARWWLGSEVTGFTGHGAWVTGYEAPDHVWTHLEHNNGARTMVEMSFSYGHTAKEPIPHFSYHLIGEGGILRYDRDGYILEARTGQATLRAPGASEKNFPGMYEAFEEALRTGDGSKMPTAEDALIATKIARQSTDMAIAARKSHVGTQA